MTNAQKFHPNAWQGRKAAVLNWNLASRRVCKVMALSLVMGWLP